MSTGTGLNVSKVNCYAILANPPGLNVTKTNAYAVLASASSPSWPTVDAANGVVGYAYTWSVTPTGATSISLLSGSLPTGLSLSGTTTATISGTPTAAGTYSFTLRATNSYGTADQAFSITIAAASGGSGGGGAWTFAA